MISIPIVGDFCRKRTMPIRAIAAALLVTAPLPAQAEEQLPNVVIVLTDDIGYGDVSSNNPEGKIQTPNIDRLAQEGVSFVDGHSSASICSPSRYALLTGIDGWRAIPSQGIRVWQPPVIPPGQFTIATMLRESGYDTGFFGKWHLGLNFTTIDGQAANPDNVAWSVPVAGGPNDNGYNYSFMFFDGVWLENGLAREIPVKKPPSFPFYGDDFLMEPGYSMESRELDLIDAAIKWIRGRDANRPFLSVIATTTGHTPIAPSARLTPNTAGPYGMYVQELDAQIGQIVSVLPQNTLVIVASDNGGATVDGGDQYAGAKGSLQANWGHDSNQGRRGTKWTIYEGGHRTPLIMRWPGHIKAGTSLNHGQYFTQTDICRTLARIVGATIPENGCKDSFDQLPLLTGAPVVDKVRKMTINSSSNGTLSIRDLRTNLKYIDDGGSGVGHRVAGQQLYDLDDDLREQHNLLDSVDVTQLKDALNAAKAGQGLYQMGQ